MFSTCLQDKDTCKKIHFKMVLFMLQYLECYFGTTKYPIDGTIYNLYGSKVESNFTDAVFASVLLQ